MPKNIHIIFIVLKKFSFALFCSSLLYAHMFWEYPIMQSSVQNLTYFYKERRWRRNKVFKICQNIYVLILICVSFWFCTYQSFFVEFATKMSNLIASFNTYIYIFVPLQTWWICLWLRLLRIFFYCEIWQNRKCAKFLEIICY